MERNELLTQIQEIFRDVLDEENIVLTEITTANDVDGWGSLTHIQLVVAIEKHLKIRFTSKEILSWKNIGEMMDSILSK
jgi:acyl carrier protein